MKRFATWALLALFCACSIVDSRAIISRVYPQGKERVYLEVTKATSDWQCTHGGFINTSEYYAFILPDVPRSKVTYPASAITIFETRSRTKSIPPLNGGEIVVDPGTNQVLLALTTQAGAFPGNGTYPVLFFSCKDTNTCAKN